MIPSPYRQWLKHALRVVLLLWVVLILTYFLRSHGALVHNEAQPLGVFSALLQSYTFSMRNSPLPDLLQAFVALGLTHLFGWLLLRALGVRLSAIPEHCLAFAIGFGVSGIAFEWLTMARLLTPLPSWLLWIALIGGAGAVAWKRRAAGPEPLLFGEEPQEEKPAKAGKLEKWFVVSSIILAGIITFTTFWHALFFPETYWDSLILYLGYARMTFLEGGFPFKAEAQVGIGLGANYPHLYPNFGALSSAMFDRWSDMPQRMAAPVAGLASFGLVYYTCLGIWRRHDVAAGAAILFRAVPYGIAYATWASDYAFAILFTAAFFHAYLVFHRRPSAGTLAVFTLIPASAMHLNYLMGILWVPWLGGVLLSAFLARGDMPALQALNALARRRVVWVIFVGGVALASTWNVRNWVLTGNPVYAFFPEIFTASIRVNPEVLRSAELEWFRNGDGVGRLAEQFWDLEQREFRDVHAPDFERRAGVRHRLAASFLFWTGFDIATVDAEGNISTGNPLRRAAHLLRILRNDQADSRFSQELREGVFLLRWVHAYKTMILMPAFFLPALPAVLIWCLRRKWSGTPAETSTLAVMLIAALTSICLLGYMYLIADFYLYQIICILIPAAIVGALLINFIVTARQGSAWYRGVLYAILLCQAIAPGIAFGLMNFKFTGTQQIYGQWFSQQNLDAFRNPGIAPSLFYRLQYGDDVAMWDYVNENLAGERLLTHENRHYVLDPSIPLIHLDDWDIQQGYDLEDPRAIYEFLRSQDLQWYLRVPMEEKHVINRRLGMELLEEAGGLRERFRSGDNVLFEIALPEE